MNLTPWRRTERSANPTLNLDEYVQLLTEFTYGGTGYGVPGPGLSFTGPGSKQEPIGNWFSSIARLAYKTNGVVFACMLARMLLFSEARFQFQQLNQGRPGNLYGTRDLRILEEPWPGATTGDLLSRAIQYADLAGNSFTVSRGDRLEFLRPDWVSILAGSRTNDDVTVWDVDAEILGYLYYPQGPAAERDPVMFAKDEVAHFAPIPDPEARFRGMSWLTPISREVMADKAATDHKLKFFENGATVNLVVKFDAPNLDALKDHVEAFRASHEGKRNAYKTLFLSKGADVTPVGKDMQQLDFKVVQGAGETRIAAAAGVPPVIVGLSEGLQAATYSNYSQARRRFADGTMRPLWRNMAASLSTLVAVPGGSRLWYDDRDIAFLRDDMKDVAAVTSLKSIAIKTLVDSGFEPATAVDAVESADLSRLTHSGLVSVQLQPPGNNEPPAQRWIRLEDLPTFLRAGWTLVEAGANGNGTAGLEDAKRILELATHED